MTYAQRVIQTFGGVRALARMLGRPVSTVGSWGERGSIPDEEKANILALSQANDLGLKPEDFFPVELMPTENPTPQDKDAAA